MSVAEKEVTALAVIEPKDIQAVFSTPNGLDPILQKIAAEARSRESKERHYLLLKERI